MPLTARPVFTLYVDLAEPIEVGPVPAGRRRIIPISKHNPPSCTRPIVGVINEAIHSLSASAEPAADPSSVAIITRPVFEASAGAPSWLNTGTFAGILRIASPVQVNIEVFRLAIQS